MSKSIEKMWAENTDPTKSGKNGNMRFDGMSAFSYNIVVAVKYPDAPGTGGTLVVADGGILNSRTTVKHKNKYVAAVPSSWKRVYVDMVDDHGDLCLLSPGLYLTTMRGLQLCHSLMAARVKKLLGEVDCAKAWKTYVLELDKLNKLGEFIGAPRVGLESPRDAT